MRSGQRLKAGLSWRPCAAARAGRHELFRNHPAGEPELGLVGRPAFSTGADLDFDLRSWRVTGAAGSGRAYPAHLNACLTAGYPEARRCRTGKAGRHLAHKPLAGEGMSRLQDSKIPQPWRVKGLAKSR